MKKVFFIPVVIAIGLALFGTGVSGQVAAKTQEKTLQVESTQDPLLGKQWLEKMKLSYEKGEYKTSLKKLDTLYKEKGKPSLSSIAAKTENSTLSEEEKTALAEKQTALLKKQRELKNLEGIRDRQLEKIAESHPDFYVSKVITSIIEHKPEKPVPLPQGQGVAIESLQKILKEYQTKEELSSSILAKQNPVSLEDLHFYTLALERDQKLQALAKKYPNTPVQKWIASMIEHSSIEMAYYYDLSYLTDLGEGKKAPKNEAESKAAKVMHSYLENVGKVQSAPL